MSKMTYKDYLNESHMPTFWCSGCGNGVVLHQILNAFEELQLDPCKTVVVSGIGCWGRVDEYTTVNVFHGTHGRALAFATGVKLANPELTVLVTMGDGDGTTIGGNHFIHAARRNIDVTAIIVNNFNYGMTGGQYSGTTPTHSITTTSRYGHVEQQFDLCELARAAGATFVSRATTSDPNLIKRLLVKGIQKKGFSFVEVIAPCPTHYGRYNDLRTPMAMVDYLKDNTVPISKAKDMDGSQLAGKFVTGEIFSADRPDYTTLYNRIIEEQMQKAKKEG